jgi:hypothetical protein
MDTAAIFSDGRDRRTSLAAAQKGKDTLIHGWEVISMTFYSMTSFIWSLKQLWPDSTASRHPDPQSKETGKSPRPGS